MSSGIVAENSIVREMLLTSVSCGDQDLLNLLNENIDTILILNSGCYEESDYLKAQLGLIDLAMIYSRNRVDEARTRAQSTGFDQYRSKYENESKAQRTSENRSCAFADATSFQQFQRDSVNRMRSQSDMESESTGNTQTTRWDRSTQSASGYSVVADYASSSTDGEGRGSSSDVQINSGKSYSKTSRDYGPDLGDLETYPNFIPDAPDASDVIGAIYGSGKDAASWIWNGTLDIVDELFGDTTITQDLRFDGSAFDLPELFRDIFDGDPLVTNFDIQFPREILDLPQLGCCCNLDGNPDTDCPDYDQDVLYYCQYDTYNPYPSYGRGFNVKYNFSIGIPWIGVLRVDWAAGEQFRQSHTVTQGCTRATGEGSTNNIYEQTDLSQSEGSTETYDESQTTRDMHTIGDSRRDSRADTTAGSATTGDAHSESHTGSDRASHSERRGSNQGTAWSKGRGRGEGLSISDSESKIEVRHWSQIFKNLMDMYTRIFEQIRTFDRIRSLSIPIAVGTIETCQYSLPKDPILAAQLRRQSLTKVYQ